jgi:V8-like Glu-specific endopeptidase
MFVIALEGNEMAELIRIEGEGGTKIYSGAATTKAEAKERYINQTGYPADGVDIFKFDECDWVELRNFARVGNE